jgi:hypothetical protein
MSKATVYQLYQLKITLADVRPPVWRRVLVTDCSLANLDAIIRTCMGWQGGHLSSFDVQGETYGDDLCGELEMESSCWRCSGRTRTRTVPEGRRRRRPRAYRPLAGRRRWPSDCCIGSAGILGGLMPFPRAIAGSVSPA